MHKVTDWIIDSRCTNHMYHDREDFINYTPLGKAIYIAEDVSERSTDNIGDSTDYVDDGGDVGVIHFSQTVLPATQIRKKLQHQGHRSRPQIKLMPHRSRIQ